MSQNQSLNMSQNQLNVSIDLTQELSPTERKQALRRYLTRARALEESVGSKTLIKLNEVTEKEDAVMDETSLEEKIEHQGEVILDSEIVTCISKIIKHCTVNLLKDVNAYNYEEYADMLLEQVQQMSDTIPEDMENLNWGVLEIAATKLFKRTPYFSTLSGALDPLPRKSVVRKAPVKRDAQKATKKPENVKSTEKEDQSVEDTVEKIRRLIINHHKMGKEPLNYFNLVLNPDQFGKTIENILHVAFLVRDGVVTLTKDESSGSLFVQPCTKDLAHQAKRSGKSAVQNIISLNPQQWKTLVRHYKIKEPMINFNNQVS